MLENAALASAHKHSIYHIDEIQMSAVCGCFYCLRTFAPTEITDWTDDHTTALCPFCDIDSVIGDASGFPITRSFLEQMRQVYFVFDGSLLDRIDQRIKLPIDQIVEFCRRNHILKLSLFGSVLRDDFRTDSDVDVLVEFEPDFVIGLIRLAGLEIELTEMIGRKVDLRTPEDLSRYFRDSVVASSELIYHAVNW